MLVTVCRFRSSGSSEWKLGVATMVDDDVKSIFDMDGLLVRFIWSWDLLPEKGCLHLEDGGPEEKLGLRLAYTRP